MIKTDVGPIGGHTRPSGEMLAVVRQDVADATDRGLLIDAFVSYTGGDIAILMSHTNGEGNTEVHESAWDAFLKATDVASEHGLYGAGQDLLVNAPSGNLRGAGPAVAEIEFDHTLSGHRPAEAPTRCH